MNADRVVASVLALTIGVSGTPAQAGAQDVASVRDSAGVHIVENPAPLIDRGTVWATVDPEVTLSIGERDGPVSHLFVQIISAFEMRDASIRDEPRSVVLTEDPAGRWILSVYDFDGRQTASIRAGVARTAVTEDIEFDARSWMKAEPRASLQLSSRGSCPTSTGPRCPTALQPSAAWSSTGRTGLGEATGRTLGGGWQRHVRYHRPGWTVARHRRRQPLVRGYPVNR